MSILTGLAEETYEDFKDDFEDGTLIVPGEKESDGQGGWIATEETSHTCKALVVDYDDYRRAQLGIPATDRRILVLAKSLSVVPQSGQRITAVDPRSQMQSRTFDIIAVSGDPAGATYSLQAR